ncbi:prepilin peptidase [uncultured Gimesia sp.]|uniref:A24 family peptidase n=1 Tax=uncultured Gimesia sp. TaxID=1678688 RepID=UPI0030D7C4A6
MGSVIGSFLNVVIYRMPLGLNISKPKSRCPICETPIRTRDNLPIVGWLLLRGKCRTCQAPISMRYPIVEAIVGCFFLLLYFSLVHSGGRFLPYRIPNKFWGAYQSLEGNTWDLIALDLYYNYLFVVILAAAYIHFDLQKIPLRLLMWCFLIGFSAGVFLPELHPVPAMIAVASEPSAGDSILKELHYHGSLHWGFQSASLITLWWGLFYGGIVGFLYSWPLVVQREKPSSLFQSGTSCLLILIGLYLGWQQVVTVGFLAAFCLACFQIAVRNRSVEHQPLPASAFVASILVLQLLLGKYLTLLPGETSGMLYLIIVGCQIIAIPILTGLAQSIYRKRETLSLLQDPISLDETSTLTP